MYSRLTRTGSMPNKTWIPFTFLRSACTHWSVHSLTQNPFFDSRHIYSELWSARQLNVWIRCQIHRPLVHITLWFNRSQASCSAYFMMHMYIVYEGLSWSSKLLIGRLLAGFLTHDSWSMCVSTYYVYTFKADPDMAHLAICAHISFGWHAVCYRRRDSIAGVVLCAYLWLLLAFILCCPGPLYTFFWSPCISLIIIFLFLTVLLSASL